MVSYRPVRPSVSEPEPPPSGKLTFGAFGLGSTGLRRDGRSRDISMSHTYCSMCVLSPGKAFALIRRDEAGRGVLPSLRCGSETSVGKKLPLLKVFPQRDSSAGYGSIAAATSRFPYSESFGRKNFK